MYIYVSILKSLGMKQYKRVKSASDFALFKKQPISHINFISFFFFLMMRIILEA